MRKLLTVFKVWPSLFFVVFATSIFSMEPSRREAETVQMLLPEAIENAYGLITKNMNQLIQVKKQIATGRPFLQPIIEIERDLIGFQNWLTTWLPRAQQLINGITGPQKNSVAYQVAYQLKDILRSLNQLREDWETLTIFFPNKVALARNAEELRRNVLALVQSEGFCPVLTFFDIYLLGRKMWENLEATNAKVYRNFGIPCLQRQEGPLGKYLRGVAEVGIMLKDFNTEEEARHVISEHPEILDVYKIHLMPKDEEILIFIQSFLQKIKQDLLLQENISKIKVKPVTEPFVQELQKEAREKGAEEEEVQVPKIVVYVYGGKDAAQVVLNRIYDHFKNWEGVDRTPRFNERVTSLIYFAQGNADDKLKFPDLYTYDGVYFKSDVTGQERDYTLVNLARVIEKRPAEREIEKKYPIRKRRRREPQR